MFHAHTRTGCFRGTHKVVTLLSLFLVSSQVLLRGAGEADDEKEELDKQPKDIHIH